MELGHTIDDIVESLRTAKERRHKACLVLGAGCSVSAGVPTAAGIVKLIKDKHPRSHERAEPKTYPKCMEQLSVAERRDMIAGLVDAAKLNWAHVAIAQLISAGYVDRVLTTNFDLLVPRACALVGEFPAIYDFAASPDFRHAQIPDKAVFCLHGQYTGFRLVNTDSECVQQFVTLRPILDNTLPGRPVIVAGYSGENDPVFTYLAERENFEYRLYWVDYEKEPPRHVREQLLEKKEKDAHFLGGCDADAFFTELAGKLSCFPPAFIKRPFSYLNGLLDRVAPFTLETSSQDFTESTRQRISRAIELLEQGEDAESLRLARLSEAEQRLMAGDFGAVFELLPFPHDPKASDLRAWAYVSWGLSLFGQARRKKGEEADRLFALAGAKYEAALAIKPDMHDALNNWGGALLEQARRKTGNEADRLFALAGAKYEAALAAQPDMHEALYNWGNVLSEQARRKIGEESDRLFDLAGAKYQGALVIKPDKIEALCNWGVALSAQARGKSGEEADRLLALAEAKYEAALAIRPDASDALIGWGTALLEQAGRRTDGEADRLFASAEAKFEAALAIKPDAHEALNNWGNALVQQARLKPAGEADRLLALAGAKYEAALAVKPDTHYALRNWGSALLERARRKTGWEADRLFELAGVKYGAALAIKPDMHEALFNWGLALAEQARRKAGEESDRLFALAEARYEAAIAVKPENHEILTAWGLALTEQARRKTGGDAERLFALARTKYEAALAIEPNIQEALYVWGGALLTQSGLQAGEERERTLKKAEEVLLRAAQIKPDEVYNLACLASLQGKPEECRELLFRCLKGGTLPEAAHLEIDADLAAVRDMEWFRDLLRQARDRQAAS